MEMDRRVKKTRNLIKESLIELILSKTYSQLTVKEIAEKANIGRKTFYLHYSCIEDVTAEIENDMDISLNEKIDNFINNTNVYDIKNVFKDLNDVIMEQEDLFKRIALSDSYNFFQKGFERMLSKAITRVTNEIFKIRRPNTETYSTFYAAGIIKLYMDWLKGELKVSLEELTRILYRSTFVGAKYIIEESTKKN